MLRTDRKAGFVTEGAWFWKRHRFRAAKLTAARALGPRVLAQLEQRQCEQPVALIEAGGSPVVVVPGLLLLGGRRPHRA
jgi:hypothetical protein